MFSYDLHVHPGPSKIPRWGDGARVWQAAADAGLSGFVWKSHEEHTVSRCKGLPAAPVRAIGSASLNPWASFEGVIDAIEEGALWLWGPTQTRSGKIGWDLPLPAMWKRLSKFLAALERPLVLATGHLGADGRAAFAALAGASDRLVCSITHSLFVPLDEALVLARNDCVFEIDAYTYSFEVDGRRCARTKHHVGRLGEAGALVYFTSDGGQASTGNPFLFGSRVLDEISHEIGLDAAQALGVANPVALLRRLREDPGA